MPKKIEILEMILHTLNGGDSMSDQQSRYHPAMVNEVIGEAYRNIIASNITSGGNKPNNFMLDGFTKTYMDVPVSYDSNREEYYAETPVQILILPFQKGIRFISPMHDQSYQFVPRSNNASVVYEELEVADCDTYPKYYYEDGKVYFKFYGTKFEKVLMKLCPSFQDLEDFDDIEMPTIVTRNGLLTLHDTVVSRFMAMAPQDLTNNANPVQQ